MRSLLPACAGLAFMVLAAPADALTADGPLRIDYAAYFWGFEVLNAQAALTPADQEVRLSLTAQTSPRVPSRFQATSRLETVSVLCQTGLCAKSYQTNNRFRDKTYRRTVEYDPSGQVTRFENVVPEDGWGAKREPVSDANRVGPDPVTAILSVLRGGLQPEQTVRSFDGAQVSQYRLTCATKLEQMEKSDRTQIGGKAKRCQLLVKVLEGRALPPPGEKPRPRREPRPVTVWFAAVGPMLAWAPVRFEIPTRLGNMKLYATDISHPLLAEMAAR
jgi:hypothetical protein